MLVEFYFNLLRTYEDVIFICGSFHCCLHVWHWIKLQNVINTHHLQWNIEHSDTPWKHAVASPNVTLISWAQHSLCNLPPPHDWRLRFFQLESSAVLHISDSTTKYSRTMMANFLFFLLSSRKPTRELRVRFHSTWTQSEDVSERGTQASRSTIGACLSQISSIGNSSSIMKILRWWHCALGFAEQAKGQQHYFNLPLTLPVWFAMKPCFSWPSPL